MTLVVRTHADGSRELEYKPPGVALDGSARDDRTVKLLQLMALLPPSSETTRARLCTALAACDAYTGVLIVLHARRFLARDTFAAAFRTFRARFPELAERVGDAADAETNRFAIMAARDRVTDPDHRFFLAVMMNLPGRAAILSAIAQRRPDQDPLEQFLGWLRACARRELLGFRIDESLVRLLGLLLQGATAETLSRTLGVPAPEISRAIQTFKQIPVLAPLFRP